MLQEILSNFQHNLFKPLILFFALGFMVPLARIPFEFPEQLYKGLTLYLLLAIGWHGGEELANLSRAELGEALAFMALGFVVNTLIGLASYRALRSFTPLRRIDAATVAGFYGSDSAGTFMTCVGFLLASNIAFASYMPVMLAVMEIPGCLVALVLASRLRRMGMDEHGNLPSEPGYDASRARVSVEHGSIFSAKTMHEVFLNPGLYFLLGGLVIGFVGQLQGSKVVSPADVVFVGLFQGALCVFLLEMGMTASRKLLDLRTAGWRFITFGLVAPNVFAAIGIVAALGFSIAVGRPLELGTYVLFAVLCGAASYIAMPAVQRIAIPESSPTLPLAASLGLTFTYNVTIGIPVYLTIAKAVSAFGPAAASAAQLAAQAP